VTDIKLRIAEHEATHAVAAKEHGLTVAWIDIGFGYDEGIAFAAAVKIPDETIDWDRDRLAVCIAMAAPSFIEPHRLVPELYRYAQVEASMAYAVAGKYGIEFDDVYDPAGKVWDEHYDEIHDLALRLVKEGKVVFDLERGGAA